MNDSSGGTYLTHATVVGGASVTGVVVESVACVDCGMLVWEVLAAVATDFESLDPNFKRQSRSTPADNHNRQCPPQWPFLTCTLGRRDR